MTNPNPHNQFVKGNKGPAVPRRRRSEKLLDSRLEEYGDRILDMLDNEALTAPDSSSRIRAADRFLYHTLLQPKSTDDNQPEPPDISVFVNAGLTTAEAILLKERVMGRQAQVTDELIQEILNERASAECLTINGTVIR